MKKIKSKIILVASILVASSGMVMAECKTAPDCASLGYTEEASNCSGSFLKCPWDLSKASCTTCKIENCAKCKASNPNECETCNSGYYGLPLTLQGEETHYTSCNKLSFICSVGSILGNDQKCYTLGAVPSGVEAIGVVFDSLNKLAIALTDTNTRGEPQSAEMVWQTRASTGYCDNSLQNCCGFDGCLDVMICETGGKVNTSKLKDGCIEDGRKKGENMAALAAYSYAPTNCHQNFCQAGNWFLPSIYEWNKIYQQKGTINEKLAQLGELVQYSYWSSNEESNNNSWAYDMGFGKAEKSSKDLSRYVRPIIQFQ